MTENGRTRLFCLGNAIVDLTMRVPALPPRGGDAVASDWSLEAGGACNMMTAAARQGLTVLYAGALGSGPFADRVGAALAAEGIEASVPHVVGIDTGFDVAVTDAGGERTFLTTLGAEARLTPGSLDGVRAGPADLVYASGYALLREPNRGTITSWLAGPGRQALLLVDPGPLAAELDVATLDFLASHVSWWSCNAREASILTGEADPQAAARELARRTRPADTGGGARGETPATVPAKADAERRPAAGRGAVVRLGSSGCVVATAREHRPRQLTVHPAPPVSSRGGAAQERTTRIPGFAVNAVDTNGAGDTHVGVFLAGLAGGLAPEAAARRANAAAALATTRPGPGTAPTATELAAFLATRPATNADTSRGQSAILEM